MKRSMLWVLVACGVGIVEQAAGSILINGSFEDGPDVSSSGVLLLSDGDMSIPGWIVKTPVPGRTINYISTYWENSDGDRSIDINGNSGPGGIAQTFATITCHEYLVSFDIASNPTVPDFHPVKTMEVSAAGQSQQFSVDSTGHTVHSMGWETKNWSFEATGPSTELWFYMIIPDWSAEGIVLDNVSVTHSGVITDTYFNVASGDWEVASNWTHGLPGGEFSWKIPSSRFCHGAITYRTKPMTLSS